MIYYAKLQAKKQRKTGYIIGKNRCADSCYPQLYFLLPVPCYNYIPGDSVSYGTYARQEGEKENGREKDQVCDIRAVNELL